MANDSGDKQNYRILSQQNYENASNSIAKTPKSSLEMNAFLDTPDKTLDNFYNLRTGKVMISAGTEVAMSGIDTDTAKRSRSGQVNTETEILEWDSTGMIYTADAEYSKKHPDRVRRMQSVEVATILESALKGALRDGMTEGDMMQLKKLQETVIKDARDGVFTEAEIKEIGELAKPLTTLAPVTGQQTLSKTT